MKGLCALMSVVFLCASSAMATTMRVDLGVTTDAAVTLELANGSKSDGTAICGGDWPTQRIGPSSTYTACFQQSDPFKDLNTNTEFNYKINDGKFILWGYTKVPFAGANVVKCQIRPSASTAEVLDSPYTCSCEFTSSGYNPKPRFKVSRKPTKQVTDRDERIRLLNEHCGAGQPECTFSSAAQSVKAATESKWVMMGAPHANCLTKPSEPHTITKSQTISWSDTIGAKVAGKFSIKVVEMTVEANYSHSITESNTYSESHTQNVPFGRVGAFYLQPGYLEISGDFFISTRESNLEIKNATFTLPLKNDYRTQSGDLVHAVFVHSTDLGDAQCKGGKASAKLALRKSGPPPAGASEMH